MNGGSGLDSDDGKAALPDDPTLIDLADAQHQLGEARAEARPSAICRALLRVGQLHSTRLEAEPALAAFQEARSLGQRVEDRVAVASADDLSGLLLCHLEEFEQALKLHRDAAAAFSVLCLPEDESLARSFASWALLEMDRAAEALVEARKAEQLDPGSGLGAGMAIALSELGRVDEAWRHVPELPPPAEGVFAWYARARAHVTCRAGDPAGAEDLFTQALDVLQLSGDRAEHRCCLRQMRKLGLEAGQPSRA